jgi:uncharacterized protein YjbI with pentapeptide repeats
VDARLRAVAGRLGEGASLAGLELGGMTFTRGDLVSRSPVDFGATDLRGATFASLDLTGARFADCDLSGASFHNANLTRADFRRCSARGAVFTDVNLAYATFAESDLRGALFFDANMADISFKGAALDGSEVDAIRLSLNGGTHVLGLKEALRALAGESSYPYIAGVSGDAFWITYYLKTRDLNWGGLAPEVLRRGLSNFGFRCSFLDEVEEDAAFEALKAALADGSTVITPLHVSAATVLGSGFGGAEWVFVTGIDKGEVLVNCLLGDGLRFGQQRFRRGWCVHHPHEEAADDLPRVYAMCVVGPRERTPSRVEATRAGLEAAVDVMMLAPTEKVAFGFDAYSHLAHDLESPQDPEELAPDELRTFLPWLGLGVLHLHGSRWAVRDFLTEVLGHGDFTGGDRDALAEALDLYGDACGDLQRALELLPWTFDVPDDAERADAFRQYRQHKGRCADLLGSAAARERDALERFRAVIEPR